jgi:hypothetical protein
VRFTQHDPATAVTTPEMIEPVAQRIAALGWHAQIHMRGEQLVAIAEMVARLPCTIVIDHMGRLPQPESLDASRVRHREAAARLGRAWVKISGAYLDTKVGPPTYSDVRDVARALIRYAPDRCVWGAIGRIRRRRKRSPTTRCSLDLLTTGAATTRRGAGFSWTTPPPFTVSRGERNDEHWLHGVA